MKTQKNVEDAKKNTVYYTQNAVMMTDHFAKHVTYIQAVKVVIIHGND